jgi:hypothetical protein
VIRTLSQTFRATTIPGSFPPAGVNLYDDLTIVSGTSWSLGATIIEQLSFNPLPSEKWVVIAYSVSGSMYLCESPASSVSPAAYQAYGKFGTIKSALLFGNDTVGQTGTGTDPTHHPQLPLPSDLSTLMDIWNPAEDSLPPQLPYNVSPPLAGSVGNSAVPLVVGNTLVLPTPKPLQQGIPVGIGVWMAPSLLSGSNNNFPALYLFNAKYSVVYDDGHN